MLAAFPLVILFYGCRDQYNEGLSLSFNDDWLFVREDSGAVNGILPDTLADRKWEKVNLPHTAMIESAVSGGSQWTGICWYKKYFRPDNKYKGHHLSLLFEGAMNDAIVYLNGTEICHNTGGYLPFFVDLTDDLIFGHENEIMVRLDNRDNKAIPPGRPYSELDFLYYSGIYRDVKLLVKDKLHITDAFEIDTLYGGGIMTGSRNINNNEAEIVTSSLILNSDKTIRLFSLTAELQDAAGTVIARAEKKGLDLMPGESERVDLEMRVLKPALWAPNHPFLYTLITEIKENETIVDMNATRIGIRDLKITAADGLILNGERRRLRGTNRHQEYPYLGYALSDNASYRDAYKIKEAGFNFVRCSHYPPSPAFLDACDELGIMVMDAIPGWKFIGDSKFRNASINDSKEMCRRDRNHPSVILWETSLNETVMPYNFITALKETACAEMPLAQCYTCSWVDSICDVFTPARQHAMPPEYWNMYKKEKPLLITEYGAKEYANQNSSGDMPSKGKVKPAINIPSRGAGEEAMLRQTFNFMKAHNHNLAGPAIGDANWIMFDYRRGCVNDIERSGIMDIFRLPKFAYWFYRSQAESSPVCFIASYNTPESGNIITVFSNADSVSLYRNNTLVGKQGPDFNEYTALLDHPPFTFRVNKYESGSLLAIAYKDGIEYARHSVTTASKPYAIRLSADMSNRPLTADGADAIFVYASVVDSTDNMAFSATDTIEFTIKGEGVIIGDNHVAAEAGIAPLLIRATSNPGRITVKAMANGLTQAEIMIESKKNN